MNHTVALEVLDTLHTDIFRIIDMSVYNSKVPVLDPVLQITLPGFDRPVVFSGNDIDEGFSLNLTACHLEVQTQNCDSVRSTLPDGIYILKYSVSPHSVIYVEYNHLRVSSIMNRYLRVLCEIPLANTEPNYETVKKLELLAQIKIYIEAAKAKVEIAHEPQKGMELYLFANKLLSKFDCRNCR